MRRSEVPHVGVLTSVHPPFDTRVFHREARAAQSFGYRVTVIAPGARREIVDGIQMEPLAAFGGRAGRPLRWPLVFWKALRLRADVYHFHDPELLPVGLVLQWVSRRPVVYDSHEYFAADVRQKRWIPRLLRRPAARIAGRVERTIAKRLAGVVAVTEEMGTRFSRFQPNTVVVRNLPPLRGAPEPPPEREATVIYTGLMDATRGLGILHEVAGRVRAERPGVEFLVYGPVDWSGLAEEVPGEGDRRWSEAGVRFGGVLRHEDVADRLERASLGWLPLDPEIANYRRAWPIKLVEYMAAGLPVVASDLPVASGALDQEGCGVTARGLEAESHARAIVELLGDDDRRLAMGTRGRVAARERYTWEAEARKLRMLYASLLERELTAR